MIYLSISIFIYYTYSITVLWIFIFTIIIITQPTAGQVSSLWGHSPLCYSYQSKNAHVQNILKN